jgi:glycosyltransferase involved in cell wall biosynthesis
MANKIFISIVTSFYNSTRFIDSYQKTVQDQEFSKQFEIIMIDDNSTDGSVKKIKKFNLKNLRIFSLRDLLSTSTVLFCHNN